MRDEKNFEKKLIPSHRELKAFKELIRNFAITMMCRCYWWAQTGFSFASAFTHSGKIIGAATKKTQTALHIRRPLGGVQKKKHETKANKYKITKKKKELWQKSFNLCTLFGPLYYVAKHLASFRSSLTDLSEVASSFAHLLIEFYLLLVVVGSYYFDVLYSFIVPR